MYLGPNFESSKKVSENQESLYGFDQLTVLDVNVEVLCEVNQV